MRTKNFPLRREMDVRPALARGSDEHSAASASAVLSV